MLATCSAIATQVKIVMGGDQMPCMAVRTVDIARSKSLKSEFLGNLWNIFTLSGGSHAC